jgi:hypothetical protein
MTSANTSLFQKLGDDWAGQPVDSSTHYILDNQCCALASRLLNEDFHLGFLGFLVTLEEWNAITSNILDDRK